MNISINYNVASFTNGWTEEDHDTYDVERTITRYCDWVFDWVRSEYRGADVKVGWCRHDASYFRVDGVEEGEEDAILDRLRELDQEVWDCSKFYVEQEIEEEYDEQDEDIWVGCEIVNFPSFDGAKTNYDIGNAEGWIQNTLRIQRRFTSEAAARAWLDLHEINVSIFPLDRVPAQRRGRIAYLARERQQEYDASADEYYTLRDYANRTEKAG